MIDIFYSITSQTTENAKTDITSPTEKEAMDNSTAEFLEYLKRKRAKNTYNAYSFGLQKFFKWSKFSGDEILKDAKQHFLSEDPKERDYWKRKIEDYYSELLNNGLTQNTARTQTLGIIGFLKFHRITVTLEREIWKVQITASDFVPSIEQYRQMFQVGDLRARVWISLSLDLAERIGDVLSIKKAEIPDLNQETPIPFERVTQKEKVIAKTFLSSETVELLKAYLPTLKTENPFLFPSNGNTLSEQAINDMLRNLAQKCGLKITSGKKLRHHAFRKRFLSTCADLRVDPNIAKILVGKQVSPDILTYLGEAQLKESWLMVREKLSLTNGKVKATMDAKDARIDQLEKELAQTKTMFKLLAEAQSETVTKALVKKLKAEGYHEAIVFGGKPETTVLIENEKVKIEPIHGKYTAQNIIDKLLEIDQLKQDRAYKKLIENGNGNGNHTS